ncbi:hypothetical protein ACFYQT_41475 [Streptomyces tibetensis]|uniref:SDR family NAD(P)-dependent oxidoreductase n=1 Tax=Streptomyces tibetensis TaxID=2382123 RepID=A0ABW6N9D4_9ACTN
MDALSREAAHLGIKVTIIEPGPYATEFASAASVKASPEIPAYDEARRALLAGFDPADVADPAVTAPALFAAVDATEPPLRWPWARRSCRGSAASTPHDCPSGTNGLTCPHAPTATCSETGVNDHEGSRIPRERRSRGAQLRGGRRPRARRRRGADPCRGHQH